MSPCLCVGGVSEHETLGNVECYNPNTNHWVVDVIPQMKYRRSGVGTEFAFFLSTLLFLYLYCLFHAGVAVLQGLLFAIGGYLEGKTSTDAVECYNPRTKRFVMFTRHNRSAVLCTILQSVCVSIQCTIVKHGTT